MYLNRESENNVALIYRQVWHTFTEQIWILFQLPISFFIAPDKDCDVAVDTS